MGLYAALASGLHRRSQAILEDHGMDSARFDRLTRSLTDAHSRRGALVGLLGGALGLLGARSRDADAHNPIKKCKKFDDKQKKKACIRKAKKHNAQHAAAALPPAPTCSDGIKNGSETGVDCGGSCKRCPNGQGCASRNDCESALCSGGTCQACTENPENCGDANGAPCFCSGEAGVCNNGVTSGAFPNCESCLPDLICQPGETKTFCAERCVAA
jgi:hypothetical protein